MQAESVSEFTVCAGIKDIITKKKYYYYCYTTNTTPTITANNNNANYFTKINTVLFSP